MMVPGATYRIQISPDFKFENLATILDYLEDLGISTVYAAPFFKSRSGSTHGYDIVDPYSINPEVGSLKEFRNLSDILEKKGMTWLQDIVPNHMAFDGRNIYIRDIFELGPKSRYYDFFDIDWEYKGLGKVLLPFFGAALEDILQQRELKLKIEETGLVLRYYESAYPLSARSYHKVLEGARAGKLAERFKNFGGNSEEWRDLKCFLLREMDSDKELYEKIQTETNRISDSVVHMKTLLDLQYFKPAHWKITEKEINYRRFFTINSLICLRMENKEVFNNYHHFISELCSEGMINGLRIDHIDGLFDPEGYLKDLRELLGDDFYIIVEKILEHNEKLPDKWPVQGSSGYDFLAQANNLFIKKSSEAVFTETYEKLAPQVYDYESLVYKKKLFILKERMGGELENLWRLLKEGLLEEDGRNQEKEWKDALSALLAAFPVYRIYPQNLNLNSRQQQVMETAYREALKESPDKKRALDHLHRLLTGKSKKNQDAALYFLQRCQQFSGPLAAKGVEDTSFYIYNRLISLNEVGNSPKEFGDTVKGFHQKMLQRKKDSSLALNTTATHDTKRGEDARMRLNVLSEIPEEWFTAVHRWKSINGKIRKNKKIPTNNEEYFIYQALTGAMPFTEENDFLERTCNYLKKVLREAKVHSNWADPDEEYENDVIEFVRDILEHAGFREVFDPFMKKIRSWGAVKSLSQGILKITAPGIPDIYQGTLLWDLSYVDPDNRRPVDYELRKGYLKKFRELQPEKLNDEVLRLRKNYESGEIKFFTLYKTLNERRKNPEIFRDSDYLPLCISGDSEGSFLAFARVHSGQWRISLLPVLVTQFFDPYDFSILQQALEGLSLQLPEDAPSNWKDIFTGKKISESQEIPLAELFSAFPVVLLKNL